jgi:ElaB/YqjD/DUF883 family membrane-anchored ribosome-binding protein
MTADADRIIEGLEKLVTELEKVTADAKDAAGRRIGGRLEEAVTDLKSMLNAAERRIGDLHAKLERRVRKTTKAANETVRENAWGAVAIGAAAALLLGFALARGSAGSEAPSDSDDSERAG